MAEEDKSFIKDQLKKFIDNARRLIPGQGASDLLEGVTEKLDNAKKK